MTDYFYPDPTALAEMVQALAGIRHRPEWSNEVVTFDAFAGLSRTGAPDPTGGHDAVSISLSIPSFSEHMVDDEIHQYNPVTNNLDVIYAGLRHFTLSINIQSDNVDSQMVAERIRAGFLRRSSVDRLHAIRCALRDVLPTRTMAIRWDRREVKATILDVLLTYSFEAADPANITGTGGWIETVEYDDPMQDES